MVLRKQLAAAAMVVGIASLAQASLTYSGDDLSVDSSGSMTITSSAGGDTLWSVDLSDVEFVNFTVGGGTFNYASPGGNGAGLWLVQDNAGTFQELEKSADRYRFSLTSATSTFQYVTTFTINTAGAGGTSWTAQRTVTNISGADAEPFSEMAFGLYLAIAGFTPTDAGAILDGTSGMADRFHRDANDSNNQYLWQINENVDRDATNLNTADVLEGIATVLDNPNTTGLGMMPGLSFHAWSDMVAYYPADSIGDANVQDNASYLERIFIEADPREFMGSGRGDHDPLAPGGSYTVNYGLDMNIPIPEPASAAMLACGAGWLLIRRRG